MVPPRLIARSAANPAGYRDLPPLCALHHLGDVRLVDVREPDEFVGPLGHIPGAELVPLATLPAAAASWDREAPVLLVCRSGARSGRGAAALAGLGFQNAYNLVGGMLAWEANALPQQRADEPLTTLAGQLHACFVAAAGGDAEVGTAAFRAAAGPGPATLEGIRRALRALTPTGSVTSEECAAWTARFERGLEGRA